MRDTWRCGSSVCTYPSVVLSKAQRFRRRPLRPPIKESADDSVPSPLPVDELCEELCNPSIYPHDPESITITQTHISVVALVPPFVYKVKKPVDFGFLDFTTLDKRRAACEAEVRLNRRLCSDTYLGVVSLAETPEGARFEPEGARFEPESGEAADEIDVAVKMRHLPPEGFLHRRAEAGQLSEHDVDAIVDHLVPFYEERDTSPAIAEQGWVDYLRVNTDENFEQTVDHVGTLLTPPAHAVLQDYTDRFYDAHAALLNRRRTGGHFIDGHGDLRLEHVHRSDRGTCIYDCIEFNDRFRHLDVANDVAFLAMDLDGHGCRRLSRYFVQQVAENLNDPELRDMVPFYKVYRAYVRGKVEGMRTHDEEVPEDEREASARRAREHYRWALRYAVAGDHPKVLVVMGQTGSGKTTQAEACADALGWRHVSSDHLRKRLAGIPLHERTPPDRRDEVYSHEMSARVYGEMESAALKTVQAQDAGVVVDATYSSSDGRTAFRDRLRESGISYAFIELVAPTDTRRARLERRNGEATVSDARVDVMAKIDDRYEAPNALWDPHHLRIQTQEHVHETTTDILRALIRLQDG